MRTAAAGLVQAFTDAQRNGCLYRLEDPVHLPSPRPAVCLADLTVPALPDGAKGTAATVTAPDAHR